MATQQHLREAGSRMGRGFYEILILLHSEQNIPYFKKGADIWKELQSKWGWHIYSLKMEAKTRELKKEKKGENNNI